MAAAAAAAAATAGAGAGAGAAAAAAAAAAAGGGAAAAAATAGALVAAVALPPLSYAASCSSFGPEQRQSSDGERTRGCGSPCFLYDLALLLPPAQAKADRVTLAFEAS